VNRPQPTFTVNVDVTNPGQVIGCCGLLELAHRLWPGAEGWFQEAQFLAAVPGKSGNDALTCLVEKLSHCEISGLSEAERKKRDELERQSRDLKKNGKKLSADQEKRLAELGKRAREGEIRIGKPFDLLLDWWNASDDELIPKTWAGQQELHKVARAAQDTLSDITDMTSLLDYCRVLCMPKEYCKGKSDHKRSVEPFYFDARRFAHRLDVGFSVDALELETIAYPAVELLCLIGLQRFRPATSSNEKWSFGYWIWSTPLSALVAAAVFSGVSAIPGRQSYSLSLRFRDDQKRYKAFGPATFIGGDI
jgi:CRISPR-associated protein Csx14